jgi:hypothetical protein
MAGAVGLAPRPASPGCSRCPARASRHRWGSYAPVADGELRERSCLSVPSDPGMPIHASSSGTIDGISSCRRARCRHRNARPACHCGQCETADLHRARELGAEPEPSSHGNPSVACGGTRRRLDGASSVVCGAVPSHSTDGRVCSVAVTITRMMTAKRLLTAYSLPGDRSCQVRQILDTADPRDA